MNCTVCKERISQYLDHQVSENLRAEMDYHLSLCPVCQTRLRETETVRAGLRQLPERPVPAAFTRQWVEALEQAAVQNPPPRWQSFKWKDWLDSMRPMMAGYSIGAVMTCVLFTGVLWSLKPIMRLNEPDVQIVVTMYDFSQRGVPTKQPGVSAETVTTVSFTPPSIASVGTSNRQVVMPDVFFVPTNGSDDGLVFIAEVSPQGKAQLVRMVSPQRNPQLIAAVSTVLGRSSFQPARERGQAVTSQMILLMEQIYVRG